MTTHAEISPTREGEALNRSPRFALRLVLIALMHGLGFEILFFGHRIGISIFLLTVLLSGGFLALAALRGKKPARESLMLLFVINFFAWMTMLRLEPMTIFANLLIILGFFALLVRTYYNGRIFRFGWLDFSWTIIGVPVEVWLRPWRVLANAQKSLFKPGGGRNSTLAFMRGLILALPIIIILLGLLTSADLIFAERVATALDWLNLQRLTEYAGRALMVVTSTVFFLGGLVIALRSESERASAKLGGIKPFLGPIEAFVVLGAVDLLFTSFVIFQFVYLFGGSANISDTGYTLAEYARRGFFELVAVGVLSIALILLLAIWTRRGEKIVRNWFLALSGILVVEVGVILISALTRLLLYENAFGFTRLRTYAHVLIPWIGILLAAFLILLVRDYLRYLPQMVITCGIGLVVTLNLLNVDRFIVRQNIARYEASARIDLDYLFSLSEDAVPDLIAFAAGAPEDIRVRILGEMGCWQLQIAEFVETHSWPSGHRSRNIAYGLMKGLEEDLEKYEITQEEWGYWHYEYHGDNTGCAHQAWFRENWGREVNFRNCVGRSLPRCYALL